MRELKLENICYRYKNAGRLALENVSCAFRPGTVSAIVGPSGSGKTTLLSIMAGLDRPSGGRVLLGEADLAGMDLDAYRRKDVSVIFQAFQLFPLLTVLENVCYPMELGGVPVKAARERAGALLESVGIEAEKFRRFPANLSGGEQQRVAIARSLATGAGVLLADEPTGNLDRKNSREILDLLKLSNRNLEQTMILITHDEKAALEADRIVTIEDGRIIRDEKRR